MDHGSPQYCHLCIYINGVISKDMQAKRGLRQGDPISPLLFVIMMEYLNRLIDKMHTNPNFNHHAKCEKLSLTNLTFVDDVFLFCRGDKIFVKMMLDTIIQLSASTGLVVNLKKCKIYRGGLSKEDKQLM